MSQPSQFRALGARPSKPDPRDYPVHRFMAVSPETLPASFEATPQVPIHDQGANSTCVAETLTSVKECEEERETGALTMFSVGFKYGDREEGDHQGEGMSPREAASGLQKRGVCPWDMYPVRGDYATCKAGITDAMREAAKAYRIAAYARAVTVDELKAAIYHTGPCMIAIPVHESFYRTGADGAVAAASGKLLGYHAMMVYGWTADGYWRVQNSWGSAWGKGGRCLLPLFYLTLDPNAPEDQRMEAWTIVDSIVAKTFPDIDPTTEEGRAVLRCAAAGLVRGYPDGEFKAKGNVTRGELCLMLDRAGLTGNAAGMAGPKAGIVQRLLRAVGL